MGFLCLDNLVARSDRWKVVFDRTGRIEGILGKSWQDRPSPDVRTQYLERFNGVWHQITHVAILVKRGQPLRAIHYLEELRNDTVEIAGLRLGLRSDNFRDVDSFPAAFRRRLEKTLMARAEKGEILITLKVATLLFFDEAEKIERKLGLSSASALRVKMLDYLALFEQ